jgi:hypothetical protein
MFTTLHDGKIYLDDIALTFVMADAVKDRIENTDEWILNSLNADPKLHEKLSNQIVDKFKQNWRRPRDGSSKDVQDMYRTVPDAVLYSADRQLEALRLAAERQADIEGYQRILNEIWPEGERD